MDLALFAGFLLFWIYPGGLGVRFAESLYFAFGADIFFRLSYLLFAAVIMGFGGGIVGATRLLGHRNARWVLMAFIGAIFVCASIDSGPPDWSMLVLLAVVFERCYYGLPAPDDTATTCILMWKGVGLFVALFLFWFLVIEKRMEVPHLGITPEIVARLNEMKLGGEETPALLFLGALYFAGLGLGGAWGLVRSPRQG